MALKGLQLAANPYPLRDYPNCPYEQQHTELELMLSRWAADPTPVSQHGLSAFLELVAEGLEREAHQIGSSYYRTYVEQILHKMKRQLTLRNKRIDDYHDTRQGTTYQHH